MVHAKLSAHPQVGDHGIIAQHQPQVFSAARDGVDAAPGDLGGESLRASRVGTHRPGMKNRHRLKAASGQVILQAPAHHLNLRELRHWATGSGMPRGLRVARRVSYLMPPRCLPDHHR